MELSIIVSICSLVVACIVCFTNLKRNNTMDDKKESSEMTTLIVKLENINDGVNEIKLDMRNIRGEVQDLRDRVIKVEESCKQAHHRLDGMG